jgi:aspartyl-tRNA synthetase
MADPIEYGVALFFGLRDKTSITYMVVQSDDISETLALDVEVANEDGVVITNHLNDRRKEINLEGVLKDSDSLPINGTQFTYASVQYILKSIDDKGVNKDYRKVSVKGIKYQEIA